MKINPAPGHCADHAQQTQPRRGNPTGDVALAGRQIVALGVTLGCCPATREFAVVEHPGTDQLQVEVAEHPVGVAAGDLRKRVTRRFAVTLERPRLNPPADRIVLPGSALRVIERVRAATLELAPAPARTRPISKACAHQGHDRTRPPNAYRQVMAAVLAELASEAETALPAGEEDALARSLPDWPVFAEVPEALAEAHRRGWRLFALSNSDRDLIEASLRAIGVSFEGSIVASEIGF
jgi:hypothetical protein